MRLITDDLHHGDHLYVRRRGLFYSHHGIYAGEGLVIHFKGTVKEKKDPVVTMTDIDNFLDGGKLKRRHYRKRLPPDETLRLAKDHLYQKGYSLTFYNCEHFATFCATGKKKSSQVRNVFSGIVGVTLAAAAAFIRKKRIKES